MQPRECAKAATIVFPYIGPRVQHDFKLIQSLPLLESPIQLLSPFSFLLGDIHDMLLPDALAHPRGERGHPSKAPTRHDQDAAAFEVKAQQDFHSPERFQPGTGRRGRVTARVSRRYGTCQRLPVPARRGRSLDGRTGQGHC